MARQTGEQMRERIKHAIAELTMAHGRPPTNRELGQHLGGKSTGHIDYHLRLMREQGIISHEPRKSRGITLAEPIAEQLIPTPRAVRIPLVGQIAAGMPIEAAEVIDDYVDLAANFADADGGSIYALRVKGRSMIDDHIDDGDIVIVRKQSYAADGDTVVAVIHTPDGPVDGAATLKRYYRHKDGMVRLQPRNSEMLPLLIDARMLEIRGVAVGVLRQM
jgi:repressor LexA